MIGNSLKSQLTTITLLPIFLSLIFVSLLILNELTSNQDEQISARAKDIAIQAGNLAEFYLYTGDTESIGNVVKSMKKLEGLQRITFYDHSGQILVSTGTPGIRTYHFSHPIYAEPFSVDDFGPVISKSQPSLLGTVELELSDHFSDTQSATYQRVLFITIPTFFVGILLSLAFSQKLKRSINELSLNAKAISDGQFDSRCEENGTGELLELQRTFNLMAEAFQQSEQHLQVKVDIATSSLSNIIDDLNKKHDELIKSRQETISLERSQAIFAERERIMQDMHDGIGGQLVASLALLEREQDSVLKQNIEQILSDCLNDLRLIINSLNTSHSSLDSLLADFKFRMNKRLSPLDISLKWHVSDIAEQIYMAPQKSLNLLRILQEIFTNILKHANATEIHFSLLQKHKNIVISVTDNGQFNPQTINMKGLGMTSIKSRSEKIGAFLTIENSESGGCHVSLKLALNTLNDASYRKEA